MQTKVVFQQKHCYILKTCSSSFDRRLFSALTPLSSPGLRDRGNYITEIKLFSASNTLRFGDSFFFPVKCYQVFFLLTLPPLADRQVSGGAQRVLPGQFLSAGAVQLGCREVA